MPRYFTQPKSWWDDDLRRGESMTIHEAEKTAVRTGLLDKDGRDIMKEPDSRPVGFVRFDLRPK